MEEPVILYPSARRSGLDLMADFLLRTREASPKKKPKPAKKNKRKDKNV